MEDELLFEENFEEIDTGVEFVDEDIISDTPVSKYEGTAESNSQEIADDILFALEERGVILTTTSGNEEEFTTTSGTPSGEYYDLLIQMNSHLEYIEEHLYEPVENTIDTPLNEYTMTNILLVGVILVLGASCIISTIKNNVFKLR